MDFMCSIHFKKLERHIDMGHTTCVKCSFSLIFVSYKLNLTSCRTLCLSGVLAYYQFTGMWSSVWETVH